MEKKLEKLREKLNEIKNQKDFETWVLSKFDDNDLSEVTIEQIEEMALDELLK